MSDGRLKNSGENNCFINSVIQVLFNNQPVRTFFIEEMVCLDCQSSTNSNKSCLTCSLKNVLTFMAFSNEAVPTQQIRESLQEIDKTSISFQLKSRGCAIETLDLILNYLHLRAERTESHNLCLAHRFFTLQKSFISRCCQKLEILEEQTYLIISGSVLTQMTKLYESNASISFVFNSIISDLLVNNSNCHCKERGRCSLQITPPPIFTVCLSWDAEMDGSRKLINFIDKQTLDLKIVFDADLSLNSGIYELESMVCYFKLLKHYVAVVRSGNGWSVKSDENSFTGSWGLVKLGMKLTRLTPVILIYKQLT